MSERTRVEDNQDRPEHEEVAPEAGLSLSNLWRMWVEHPGTQAWVVWQKWLWAINPASRLIPLDFEQIWSAYVHLGDDLAARPEVLHERTAEVLRQYTELYIWMLQRWLGEAIPEPVAAHPKDRRFQDDVWVSNLYFSAVKQAYLILAYGGHITSIINPPVSRRGFYYTMDLRSNAAGMDNADEWLKSAARNQDSWWPDWVSWLSKRSGKQIAPPPFGLERGSDKRYAPIVAAPGMYVLEE